MNDLLTEDDQWEALKRWLKENGAWILGGVILGGGALLGWRWWEANVTDRSQTAAIQFAELQTALTDGKQARAQSVAGEIQQRFKATPYADQAALALVRIDVQNGDLNRAAERLDAIVKSADDPYLREVARLRLARVQLAQNKPDQALATLAQGKPGDFSAAYDEVRGDALLAQGDREAALDAYRSALTASAAVPGDSAQLQLKIADLAVARERVAPASAATPPPAQASNEARVAAEESQ